MSQALHNTTEIHALGTDMLGSSGLDYTILFTLTLSASFSVLYVLGDTLTTK